MNRRNYQKELEEIIRGSAGTPTLLLHACCAPCSSYVLEYLSRHFAITVFYYNPNITDEVEYRYRTDEVRRLISLQKAEHPVAFCEGPYEPERFFQAVKGLEKEKEGGKRCGECFKLRLAETAKRAKEGKFDYFTTTLSISPLKNAELLNTIGEREAEACGGVWLPSEFKKKGGYQRSIELSKEYGLYRQEYCGCIYSKLQREEEKKLKEAAE